MADANHPLTLAQRMDRQEKALGDLRQDTASRFGEMRAMTSTAIDNLRSDVREEFRSVNTKLDEIAAAVNKPPKRKLIGR